MHSISEIAPETLASIQGVFADIDETISTRGKITPQAFEAMWRLSDAGIKVIPVTGRAAGWCDHIARFWPVDAVVGENGGFYFYHDGKKLHRRFLDDESQRRDYRKRLEVVREEILRKVPGSGIASDQLYREYDLAVDFCEDVEPLPREKVLEIQSIFEAHGAHAKVSSIHVNGWFGDFDKLSTTILCAEELFGIDLESCNGEFAFCGDSPNDEPMFAYFQHSFGMANVRPFLSLIKSPPSYITTMESGAGFVEVAELILCARGEKA